MSILEHLTLLVLVHRQYPLISPLDEDVYVFRFNKLHNRLPESEAQRFKGILGNIKDIHTHLNAPKWLQMRVRAVSIIDYQNKFGGVDPLIIQLSKDYEAITLVEGSRKAETNYFKKILGDDFSKWFD